MIEKIILNKKEITIRELNQKDIKEAKKFQDFYSSLIEENAKILMNKKPSLKEQKEKLEDILKQKRKKLTIFLVVENRGRIIAITNVHLGRGRQNHVGDLGITIRKSYRGIGLGSYLMKKIIKLAKKELKVKILRLNVFPNNRPAINLYKKHGFKKFGRIPDQFQDRGKLVDEIVMLKYL